MASPFSYKLFKVHSLRAIEEKISKKHSKQDYMKKNNVECSADFSAPGF